MKRFAALSFIFIFLLSPHLSSTEKKSAINIIPQPARVHTTSGEFEVSSQTQILLATANDTVRQVAEYFAAALKQTSGYQLTITSNAASTPIKNSIAFVLSPKEKLFAVEEYRLSVTRTHVLAQAATPRGLFYAMQTMLQLLPAEVLSDSKRELRWAMPCVEIEDQPRFSWRGMHLDVSRHFFSKEFVKRYIDLLALHKMNVFHWDLTNDNGWRLEIKKYPKLTEVCAWRVDREQQPWMRRDPPAVGEKATYGGFYTQEDVKEILAYAAARFVTVLPAMELPGHTSEVFAAYPQLSCRGEGMPVQVGSYWPNVDIFCAGNDSVFTFIDDVLTEVAALFPNQYIHIGGDEADKTRWKECAKCQARMQREGLKDEHELQSYFVKRVEKMLTAKGKNLIGWDEILEGGLAPEATVMSWRGIAGGIAAAQQGHDAIMTPTSHCYFDYFQANPKFEPEGIGGFVTLKKVYSYEPIPATLNAQESKHILGAQGNVWTEYIATPAHAEYMSLPRMSALAEVVWSPKESRNWENFHQRLRAHFKRFDALKANYSKGSFAVELKTELLAQARGVRVQLESEQPHAELRYTLDGSAPTMQSPRYRKAFVLHQTATINAGLFVDGKIKEEATQQEVLVHRALGA
ncbi:MAG: family 20 glycosylhydrolase, partial [candidate division KSB1 bacterium]